MKKDLESKIGNNGFLQKFGRIPFVKELSLASSFLGFSLFGCSKDNPVEPKVTVENNAPIVKMISADLITNGVRIAYIGTDDDGKVVEFKASIDGGGWFSIQEGENWGGSYNFTFSDKNNHRICIKAIDDDSEESSNIQCYDYQPVIINIVTTEQKELTTSNITGAVAFYSDMDKKNIAVRLIDKNGFSVPIASDVKYYSDLEQIVATSMPRDNRYLPSLYIENRTNTDLAGIKDGIISLVTYALSETKYGSVSIKMYNDLPNLFQNKTIIPGMLKIKGSWSFNDIKNGNYWVNQTSKILIPVAGEFTAPIVLGTEASGKLLDSIDDILGYIELVTGKKIDRDQKIDWYNINPDIFGIGMLGKVDIPNLIPFFVDIPTQTFNVPTSYNDATLAFAFNVDTVGVRNEYSTKWDSWSVNMILDSKYSSIRKYIYSENNTETIGLTTLTFSSSDRAKEFNQQYLSNSLKYMSNVYYFPNSPELKDVYYFRNGVEVPSRDYLVFFFPVKNFWVGMDVLYGTPDLMSAGIGMATELRKLNP